MARPKPTTQTTNASRQVVERLVAARRRESVVPAPAHRKPEAGIVGKLFGRGR